MKKFITTPLILIFPAVLFLVGLASEREPMKLAVEAQPIQIFNGEQKYAEFEIEVARTDAERSAGLMFRTDLPKNRGMLFVFEVEAELFFWMENTPTSLDIIYANRIGQIVHIAKNTTPFSRDPIASRFPAKFAFEIHAGLSGSQQIMIGHKLVHPLIEKK